MASKSSGVIKLQTKDGDIFFLSHSLVQNIPGLQETLHDIFNSDDVDIILPEYSSKSVNHIINIAKYGATAVLKDDVKDVVDAGKLFLNIDLSSGSIKKGEDGYEFEIAQGYRCKKYFSGTKINKELLYITKNDLEQERDDLEQELFEETEKQMMLTEQIVEINLCEKELHADVQTFNLTGETKETHLLNEMNIRTENNDMICEDQVSVKFAPKQNDTIVIDDDDFDVEEEPGKNKTSLGDSNKYKVVYKRKDQEYKEYKETRPKQLKAKKQEIQHLILNSSDRVRLYQHYYKNNSVQPQPEKLKYPGLIIDNEITEFSVCLECCTPFLYNKNHICGPPQECLKKKEVEKVNDFSKNQIPFFQDNFTQVDVDRAKCKHCGDLFFDVESLKKHLNDVHDILTTRQVFMCKYCGKVMENEKTKQNHELRIHGNVEYASHCCDFCGKAFIDPYRLERHVMFYHGNTRPFICDICPKAFKLKLHLTKHRLIHTGDGERNFNCKKEGCGKSFTKDLFLVQHERIHTLPYHCQPCGFSFVQNNFLAVHMNTHHQAK